MRFISTSVHGTIDYLVGILLIAAPWLFNFDYNGAETVVPVTVGITIILYSLFTNYEKGVVRKIPMSLHLWLDGLGGLFLAASPWIFNFDETVFVPHLFIGIAEVLIALLTQVVPVPVKREIKVRHSPSG